VAHFGVPRGERRYNVLCPNDTGNKSLHYGWLGSSITAMKAKIFTCTIVAGCMLSSIAFGQTLTISGTICSCDSKQVTVQEGTHYWMIKRTPSTSVDGACSAGSTVTVQCKSPDAQRKEGQCPTTSGPKPAP